MNPLATAPATVQGIHGSHFLGSLTLSSLSLACGIVMLAAWRGAKRLTLLRTPDGAATWALVTGSVWMAAGASWGSAAGGIAAVPTSIIAGGDAGNVGAGGTALVLTLVAYIWPWKKTLLPTILGIGCAVTYAAAGGIWGVVVNGIRVVVGQVTGGA